MKLEILYAAQRRRIDDTAESWCGRGDLNPHAFRRHPLKMVCLPVPPLPRAVQESNCYPVNARVRALLETKFVFNVIASLPALQCSTVRPSRYSGPAQYWASRPFRKSPEVCE